MKIMYSCLVVDILCIILVATQYIQEQTKLNIISLIILIMIFLVNIIMTYDTWCIRKNNSIIAQALTSKSLKELTEYVKKQKQNNK
jgi:glucan phosphoethanolaminetransferase (alkaline phosphatase superfamily)